MLTQKTLEILGPYRGADEQNLQLILDRFENETGVKVNYTGSPTHVSDVIDAAVSGTSDIVVIPQPGLVQTLASYGLLAPVSDTTIAWVENNYASGRDWNSLTKLDGDSVYGFFFNTNMKSLVWYSPDRFDTLNLEIPNSFEDLQLITQTMAESGLVPWAMPFGSNEATGWPGTDWIEDLILLTSGAEDYNSWISGELKFSSEVVQNALKQFELFGTQSGYDERPEYLSENNFWEGIQLIASDLEDTSTPLMLHQASIMTSFASDQLVYGSDYDFFQLPPLQNQDSFMRVGGTSWSIVESADIETAQLFLDFLQNPDIHEMWLQAGGFLTPLNVSDEILSEMPIAVANLQKAFQELDVNDVVFDGSDMMPPEIGADLFWEEMSNFFATDVAALANRIDSAWPSITTYSGNNASIALGSNASDIIEGGEKIDFVSGGAGNDILSGGGGIDILSGGDGADHFVFSSIADFGDVIEDFSTSEDTIALFDVIFSQNFSTENLEDVFNFEQVDQNTVLKFDSSFADATTDPNSNTWVDVATFKNLNATEFNTSNIQTNVRKIADLQISSTVNISIGEDTPTGLALEFVGSSASSNTASATNGALDRSDLGTFSHVMLDSSTYSADIAISDVISSLKHIVGLETLDGAALHAADVDNDDTVAIADVISQLKHIVGLETLNTFDLVDTAGTRVTELTEATTDLQLVLNGDVDLSTALNSEYVSQV
jgi:alpha-glucoside transport system substrate-binding protein